MSATNCPDGGRCHHQCPYIKACFRVAFCGPLSAAGYPGDTWPDGMSTSAREARDAMIERPIEDFIVGGAA